jgi:hypothetical protein
MRKTARRESAKAWLDSGAQIIVKMYARRYGVDRYTAREDLEAIGFVSAPAARHMAATRTRWIPARASSEPHRPDRGDEL